MSFVCSKLANGSPLNSRVKTKDLIRALEDHNQRLAKYGPQTKYSQLPIFVWPAS